MDSLVRKIGSELSCDKAGFYQHIEATQRMANVLKAYAKRKRLSPEGKAAIMLAVAACREETRRARNVINMIEYDEDMLANLY